MLVKTETYKDFLYEVLLTLSGYANNQWHKKKKKNAG